MLYTHDSDTWSNLRDHRNTDISDFLSNLFKHQIVLLYIQRETWENNRLKCKKSSFVVLWNIYLISKTQRSRLHAMILLLRLPSKRLSQVEYETGVTAGSSIIIIIRAWMLASDWSIQITWPEYWPLIGPQSRYWHAPWLHLSLFHSAHWQELQRIYYFFLSNHFNKVNPWPQVDFWGSKEGTVVSLLIFVKLWRCDGLKV